MRSKDVTKKVGINGKHIYVTKLFGEDEEEQFHTLIVNNENIEKPYVHTGDRASSEKFIKDNTKGNR